MIDKQVSGNLLNHIRSKVVAGFDPATMFVENKDLPNALQLVHKGFYIGILSSTNEEVIREGFLKEDLQNVLESANIVIENVIRRLKQKSIPLSQIHTSSFHLTIVSDVVYIQNPTHWDENKDGVYFQWGQNYKALYLPYQIKRMNIPKIEIMDRLCGWEAGLAANLWRKPEGLVWKMTCFAYPD